MERFIDKISPEPNTGCWLWCGSYFNSGYGRFAKSHSESVLAHRFSWEIAKGAIPAGTFVCHRCDCSACVNPSHLFLGTPQQNMDDKVAKGRQTRGQGIRKTPITPEVAVEIFQSKEAARVLAARFGVVPGTIHNIRSGLCWAHATRAKL